MSKYEQLVIYQIVFMHFLFFEAFRAFTSIKINKKSLP